MHQKESSHNLRYYIRVWRQVLRASLKKGKINKGEMWVRYARALFVVITQVILLNAVFGKEEVFVGWSKNDALLVMGIWNFVNYTGWSMFAVNFVNLEQKVLNGEFDFTLLKPLSSAWLASFGDFFIYNIISSISGLMLIVYYIVAEWSGLIVVNIIIGILGIIAALVIWYGVYLIFSGFSISNPRNGALILAKEILGLTKFPSDIWGGKLQLVLYTILPLAFISTVPAKLMSGDIQIWYLFIAFIIGILFVFVGLCIWKWNVKRYTSSGG